MIIARNRLTATASVIITNGEFEFEGAPNLDEIDGTLREICRDKQIYCTVSPARSEGHPAVLIYMDSPKFSGKGTRVLKEAWKNAARKAIFDLTTIVSDSIDTIVSFSDGTSCSTSD